METELKRYFGKYGGQFIAETLFGPLEELEIAFSEAIKDGAFIKQFEQLCSDYTGRPSPLSYCERSTHKLGGAKLYLKREDLNHTGSHKINNAIGQGLLAKRMGKNRIIAETGAGQHGVATASICALLGLECTVYMGAVDGKRQAPNLQRMRLLGADVRLVESGSQTLKDAINEAERDWISSVHNTHYLVGSAVGPYPFPSVVRYFQSVIGKECRQQLLAKEGNASPDLVVACVGGGSNAIGIFQTFLEDSNIRLVGVQAGGEQVGNQHSAPLVFGKPGVLHGAHTRLLQDADGQITESHSIAPGLDYPAVGPEHSHLAEIGRVEYVAKTDQDALKAFQFLCAHEGIIPALESCHALAYAFEVAPNMGKEQLIVVNLSGRGDKDLNTVNKALEGRK
ncbi:MAG: tryptophan synthase subunit beta [Oligoflexales bacterium]